jgi:hypothetical protein
LPRKLSLAASMILAVVPPVTMLSGYQKYTCRGKTHGFLIEEEEYNQRERRVEHGADIGGTDEDDEAWVAVVLDLGELRHTLLLLGLPVRPAPSPASLHHQRAPRRPHGSPCQLQPTRQETARAGIPAR